jgi:hypothetical protein
MPASLPASNGRRRDSPRSQAGRIAPQWPDCVREANGLAEKSSRPDFTAMAGLRPYCI